MAVLTTKSNLLHSEEIHLQNTDYQCTALSPLKVILHFRHQADGFNSKSDLNFDHAYPSFWHSVLHMYFIYKFHFLKMMNKLLYAFGNIIFH